MFCTYVFQNTGEVFSIVISSPSLMTSREVFARTHSLSVNRSRVWRGRRRRKKTSPRIENHHVYMDGLSKAMLTMSTTIKVAC